jgi:hypothetical protein
LRTYFWGPVGGCKGLLGLAVSLEDEGGRFLDEGPAFRLGLEPDRVGGLILDEGQLGLELFERTNNIEELLHETVMTLPNSNLI